MRRPLLALALIALAVPTARADDRDTAATIARDLSALQNPDGGFASRPGGPSSLGATSNALRVLSYVGGAARDVEAAGRYILTCRDEQKLFLPGPGGKPSPGTTATGLMAMGAARVVDPATVDAAIKSLGTDAKSYEDIRISVAGLEAVGATSPDFPRWIEQINADRNPDGTWGSGPSKAFDTGGRAVALLRMGVDPGDRRDAILATLRAGQNADGGWSGTGSTSELGATYRVMRGFWMLRAVPDLGRLRAYLDAHRRPDGYASKPGADDAGGTYFCTVMLKWLRWLAVDPRSAATPVGFVALADGKSLDGWEGDTSLWSAKDGMIVGRSPGIKRNEFLATTKSYRDFFLEFSFKLTGPDDANSGVQFRSVRVDGGEMSGYQADIGQGYWGCLYDESRRKKIIAPAAEKAKAAVKPGEWNKYSLRVMGNHITMTLNGVGSFDYREEDPGIARDGKIALQIHAGGPMEIAFKGLVIQELPTPAADDAMTPGFHLRTIETPTGPRKYGLYLPTAYDGKRRFPVALFLHGSGERGIDGEASSQVGLGAAIANHPRDYPLIAVFPQARQTWAAGSDDAKYALMCLDETVKSCAVEPDRVILTGISMGGFGSWEVGSAEPGRFSAIAPVCGFGDPAKTLALKGKPVWTLLGDADNARIVDGTRAIVAALKAAGGAPRLTEYPGVGHNSWDRAYNNFDLIEWMLAQKRP